MFKRAYTKEIVALVEDGLEEHGMVMDKTKRYTYDFDRKLLIVTPAQADSGIVR